MLLSLAAPVAILVLSGLVLGPKLTFTALVANSGLICTFLLLIHLWCTQKLPHKQKGAFGFFHPFANGGGGGERVLWCAVAAVQAVAPEAQVIIFSGDGLSAQQLLESAASNFNITVTDRFQVVQLHNRHLLLPERYPRFTLLGQALGSFRLGHEALKNAVPEIFVDTTGWAFTYPLARLAGCKVVAYTHYPMVSANMLQRVMLRTFTYNNQLAVAKSGIRSLIKVVYYYVVAAIYGAAGGFANVSIVNSTWTADHIRQLWWKWKAPTVVFPPCNTLTLQQLPLDRKLKRLYLVSVAQFRPEKNHRLQLEAFARVRQAALQDQDSAESAVLAAQLKLVGSCRGPDDKSRLTQLQSYSQALGLHNCVEFCINVPFDELTSLLAGAVGGLHTMLDEHFGISIVEYMAAGVVPIVHDSGGPRADIVKPERMRHGWQTTGYLCTTEEQYANAITEVLCMDQQDRLKIAAAARQRAAKFSDQQFEQDFVKAIQPLL
ncbi:hypothetical protein WJX77_001677 [Trebouxia sp. C0004]